MENERTPRPFYGRTWPPASEGDRRHWIERRQRQCRGYAYITTVGWICRREQCRRKIDAPAFPDPRTR
jgi:hypothetical protein